MPVGRLINRLNLTPLVWGRCFSVVAADFEYASDTFEEISPRSDTNALREIEAMYSARMRDRVVLLSGNARSRPVGPFSSVLLEAFSIRSRRDGLDEEVLGGWLCHSREEDAISAAQQRFARFCSASAANGLSAVFQIYSARVAGRFATSGDILELLVGGRSANDPQTISDTMVELRAAGIDGIVLDQDECRTSALVLRGCAVSQLRQVRQIEIRWEGVRAVSGDDSNADQYGWPGMCPADPGVSG